MNSALFARTVDDTWIRVTPFVSDRLADDLWASVAKPEWIGQPATIANRWGGDPVRVKYFALRPNAPEWTDKQYFGIDSTVVKIWSKRVYADEVAAAKAWNKASGSNYIGTEGGWVYRAEEGGMSENPVCQGWRTLVDRKGVLLSDLYDPQTNRRGYRYQVARITVSSEADLTKVGV